ncbi:hypothetical protein T439DRAFT_353480 [Meredithblackwellia eburnea MCA 4105]
MSPPTNADNQTPSPTLLLLGGNRLIDLFRAEDKQYHHERFTHNDDVGHFFMKQ